MLDKSIVTVITFCVYGVNIMIKPQQRIITSKKLGFSRFLTGIASILVCGLIALSSSHAMAQTVGFAAPESTVMENGSPLNVTIVLSEPAASTVNLTYSSAGSATKGSDYQTLSGVAQITAGSFSTQILVTPINDSTQETPETVVLTLTGATGASLGTNLTHTVTIKDDDIPFVEFTSSAASKTEKGGTVNAALNLSKINTLPVDAYYRVNGTASGGTDYTPLSGVVHFNAGQQTATIPIALLNDSLEEPDETVVLELYGAIGGNLGNVLTYSLTIMDDELPTVAFVKSTTQLVEAQTDLALDVELTRPIAKPVTVTYAYSGTATLGSDYTGGNGTLTIPAGQYRGTIPVSVKDDTEYEGDETVVVTLTGATSATLKGQIEHTVTIVDNEVPAVEFTASEGTIVETGGTHFAALSLSHAATKAITVRYAVEGTAASGADYTALTGTVVFAVGTISQSINIGVLDDKLKEDKETVILKITDTGAEANLGLKTVYTLTILDDDQYPPLQISPNGVSASMPDVCIDRLGNAHIIWRANQQLWYAQVDPQNQIVAPARQITSGMNVLIPRVAVDKDGIVHVVHTTASGASSLGYIRISSGTLARSNGFRPYQDKILFFGNQTYNWPAIAVNPRTNAPVVICEGRIQDYADPAPSGRDFITAVALDANGRAIRETRFDAFGRNFGMGIGYSFDGAQRPDIAIGADGTIRAAWRHRETGWSGYSVAYRSQTMANWIEVPRAARYSFHQRRPATGLRRNRSGRHRLVHQRAGGQAPAGECGRGPGWRQLDRFGLGRLVPLARGRRRVRQVCLYVARRTQKPGTGFLARVGRSVFRAQHFRQPGQYLLRAPGRARQRFGRLRLGR